MDSKTRWKMNSLLGLVVAAAVGSVVFSIRSPFHDWVHFSVYLGMVILASGLRVRMPGGDSTISINLPFILLTIIDGSPLQALLISTVSVYLQCTRPNTRFTFQQVVFNVSNSILSTVLAWWAYTLVLKELNEIPPAVAAAVVAYALTNILLVTQMIGWATGNRVYDLLRETFQATAPYYLFAAFMAAAVSLISAHYGWMSGLLLFPVVWACYHSVSLYVKRQEERKKHLEEMASVNLRTIEALAMAIEAKDENTHEHLCRVRVYVEEIGRELRLGESEMQALQAGSLLHDIGKLAIPEHILTKPGKLTPEEFEKMKIHPIVGADILSRVGFSYPVVPIVRSHHERWDGQGYPDGLIRDQIPIGARILAVVDCFDALTSDRPYRPALPLAEAMTYVKEQAGKRFDPAIVDILERRYHDLEAKAKAEGAKMEALKTSFQVIRGEAPAAGFAEEGEKIPTAGSAGALARIAAAGQEAQVLFQLGQTLGNSLSLDATMTVLAEKLRQLVPHHLLVMHLVHGEQLVPNFVKGDAHIRFSRQMVPMGDGLSGWVAHTRKSILNGNPSVEPGIQTTALRSALAVPVEAADGDESGQVFGVLALYSLLPDAFTRDHLRIMQAIIHKAARAIENSLNFKRVESEAVTDFLTGVLNARGFLLEAERKLSEPDAAVALLACDLNNFKSVNDTDGHPAGDELLRLVAAAFVDSCGEDGLVARLGGDEFIALISAADPKKVESITTAILAAIESGSTRLLGRPIGASLGTAFLGEDGNTLADLAAVADQRMYHDKRGRIERHRRLQMVMVS
jgi:diguanylate cyclase (GGDEF)-like protein/putative nucleotidyltransferase with HDIG domain